MRRGRPGLTGAYPVADFSPWVVPAANDSSRIFVRIGNGLNGPTDTISFQGEALRIVLLGDSNPLVDSVDTIYRSNDAASR